MSSTPGGQGQALRFRVVICPSPAATGCYGAALAAAALNRVLAEQDRARLLLSTGQSQFEVLGELVRRPVDWRRVDVFHLDEYIGLSQDHPASFRRYLKERFADVVPVQMHYVNASSAEDVRSLSDLWAGAPAHVGLVGIGENGHIAFNDPPADLSTQQPYITVQLDQRCRAQQVREGWFSSTDDVPRRAITMSVSSILKTGTIISVVPHFAKAPVMRLLLGSSGVDATLPATALSEHPSTTIVLDRSCAQLLPPAIWAQSVVL